MRAGVLIALVLAGCAYDFDEYLPTPGGATAACTDAGARAFNQHCYFPTSSPQSFQDSKKACEASGAHLATVTTAAEQTALEPMVATSDAWFGLSRPPGSASNVKLFAWVTGEVVSYSHWQTGEPSGSGECARMKRGGLWGDSSCAAQYVAICERE